MWNLLTLDGFVEGASSWDLVWHERVWGEELESVSLEQLRTADRLLFGRITYEGMAAYWAAAEGEVAELMNALPKVVFSRTMDLAEWSNTTLLRDDAATEVLRLKGAGDGNTFVFGSGKTLFGRDLSELKLRLLEARPLSSGAVILRYAPDRSG
jgi:dihydrofolate reductase